MIADVIAAVRERAPLVHCLSAAVSLNFVADAVLAAGARPMMTETLEEAPVMVQAADALLVNLGTLSTDGAAGIPATAARARELGTPWVLDPTAVGLAPVRTPLARHLLTHRPAVIRGNASEILNLAGAGTGGRGADTVHVPEQAAHSAHLLALATHAVVAVSGARDLITDGERSVAVTAGHPLLTRVTGTGCTLGALTAACAAVADPFEAAHAATAWLCVAAEDAAGAAAGPGSFKVALLDALAAVDPHAVEERALA
ncbi:hydroxyethylthiazole kinase [Tessaracoccus lubricantis]|uniref:Hydroxyethylthiazole kinase n=1 Tax=Tessaracoccus lubricantis TaxID=545543 RepID=A0ABP9F5M0_9ACTN